MTVMSRLSKVWTQDGHDIHVQRPRGIGPAVHLSFDIGPRYWPMSSYRTVPTSY
jgi:hypothetical protein